jgi:hypothetical protein
LDRTFSIHGAIRDIVNTETKFHRLFWGEVLSTADSSRRGRIQVSVPSLGRDTQDKAIFAYPAETHKLVVPKKGDLVVIAFMFGRPAQAVYFGQAHWLTGATPKSYDGPDTAVLYEDPDGGLSMVFKRTGGTFEIETKAGDKISMTATGITIKGATVTLQTGDAAIWLPNVLPVDPLTGVPHGGPTAGIVKLTGL